MSFIKSLFGVLIISFGCILIAKDSTPNKSSSIPLKPTSKMREETLYFIRLMQELHYKQVPFQSVDFNKLINLYVEDIDYNRLFFCRDDIDAFEKDFGSCMDILLRAGSLAPAFEMFEVYKKRVRERVQWILKFLNEEPECLSKISLEEPKEKSNVSYKLIELFKRGPFWQKHERQWQIFKDPLICLGSAFQCYGPNNYNPDRHKAPWFVSMLEADTVWEKRLAYELLNEMLSQKFDESKKKEASQTHLLMEAKKKLEKRYTNMLQLLDEIEASEVQEAFLNCFACLYDPHSAFLSTESMESFSIGLRNSLVGIGVVLSRDDEGNCVIREIIPGGPADKSKAIRPGDKIVAVAEREGKPVDIVGMKITNTVKLIRGKVGTPIRLTIQPVDSDRSDRKIISLVREEVKLTANLASARLYDVPMGAQKKCRIGVIDLSAFYGPESDKEGEPATTHDVEELVQKLRAQGIQGLILDLRRNGGGLLKEAIDLTGLFLPAGPVVQVKNSKGEVMECMDNDKSVAWSGPLMVLVSRCSASASEIVAGALKVNRRALVVGDSTTHGKGTVQAIIDLNELSLLPRFGNRLGSVKVTIQKWYLPDGSSTQVKGVPSDIAFPSLNDILPLGEDDLPNALAWDSIPAIRWDYEKIMPQVKAPVNQKLIEYLREKSKERQSYLEEFKLLRSRIERSRELFVPKALPLNFFLRQQMRQDDEKFRKQVKEKLQYLAKKEELKSDDIWLAIRPPESKNCAKNKLKEDEEDEKFDISSREAIRIMADWIEQLRS